MAAANAAARKEAECYVHGYRRAGWDNGTACSSAFARDAVPVSGLAMLCPTSFCSCVMGPACALESAMAVDNAPVRQRR